ncbi:MAG: HEPN domain-containing protein [Defluviitaleaceae bacterium]|nr:HEPN domain-containing protein [Defluviitaleaceae bacterium]
MDYYEIAEEPLLAASSLQNDGLYRMSVCMATLAIDLLLKSVLYRMDSTSGLLMGHDHIGMLRTIEKRYPKPKLRTVVKLSRKYFNDSRYSNNDNFPTFTKELAKDFIDYVQQVKDYVDIDCQATLDDFLNRFNKRNS